MVGVVDVVDVEEVVLLKLSDRFCPTTGIVDAASLDAPRSAVGEPGTDVEVARAAEESLSFCWIRASSSVRSRMGERSVAATEGFGLFFVEEDGVTK